MEDEIPRFAPTAGRANRPANRLTRMRVELADVPGALAGATAVLAALGVDVAGIDVLEVDGGSVVDEMLLRLPVGMDVGQVTDALRMAGAREVLSSRDSGPVSDPTVLAFQVAAAALDLPDGEASGSALARVAYADVGALLDVDNVRAFPLARRALETGVPASGRAGPDAAPLALTRGWVLWVAPQVAEPRFVLVVGRRLDIRFAATEAARLRALATLLQAARQVAA